MGHVPAPREPAVARLLESLLGDVSGRRLVNLCGDAEVTAALEAAGAEVVELSPTDVDVDADEAAEPFDGALLVVGKDEILAAVVKPAPRPMVDLRDPVVSVLQGPYRVYADADVD